MDRNNQFAIGDHGERCLDMRDQVRFSFITRFGQMNLLSCPGGASFVAVPSFRVIGRVETHSSRRKIFRLTPP